MVGFRFSAGGLGALTSPPPRALKTLPEQEEVFGSRFVDRWVAHKAHKVEMPKVVTALQLLCAIGCRWCWIKSSRAY